MSRIKPFIIILLMASVLMSCSAKSYNQNSAMSYDSQTVEMPAFAPAEEMEMAESAPIVEERGFSASPSVDYDTGGSSITKEGVEASLENTGKRVVIKNANLSIVVENPSQTLTQISSMAEEMGGFTVSSEIHQTTTQNGVEVQEGNITVRVPAQDLNQVLDKIKALTDDPENDILNENISGQDVTREYTDLQSRLTNLEKTADKLESIMEEAKRTEDVLSVYLELSSINEQIEVIRGQIKYYDETSSLSAVSVRLIAQESIEPLSIGKWEPQGIARDAIQGLIEAIKFIISAIIWIILFVVPVLILIVIPIYLIILLIRRIRKNRRSKKIAKTEDNK